MSSREKRSKIYICLIYFRSNLRQVVILIYTRSIVAHRTENGCNHPTST